MSNGSLKTWHKLAFVLIPVLAIALFMAISGSSSSLSLPSFSSQAGDTEQIARLTNELTIKHKEHELRLKNLAHVRSVGEWFYPAGTDANHVQKEVESIAFKTGLNYSILRSIAGRTEKNDYLTVEEVNITGTVDIKDFVAFSRALESHKPILRWSSCTLTPRSQPEILNTVFISGRIRAYVLNDAADTILSGEPAP